MTLQNSPLFGKQDLLDDSDRPETFIDCDRRLARRAGTVPALRPRPHIASLSQSRRPMLRVREAYGHFRADDAPPWLTILVVGHITIPIILALEQALDLALWVELAIYLPLITLLTLVVLPRCKGVILAVMWAMKAEGSEKI